MKKEVYNIRREAVEALAEKLDNQMKAVAAQTNAIDMMIEHHFYRAGTNEGRALQLAALVEERAMDARGNHELQAEMVAIMAKIAMIYHKDLSCEDISVAYTNTRVFMMALARIMLEINYSVDLSIGNMILSEHPFALDRAEIQIRHTCRDYLCSHEYIEYLKASNVAYIYESGELIIQLLTGAYSTATGYEAGRMLSVRGVCLDPSMKGWDMIMFIMYT